MALKLKLDADGKAVFQNSLPVFVYDDGKEITVDADAMFAKIAEVSGEAKTYRLEAKQAKEVLAQLGDVEPTEVAKILNVVKEVGGIDGIDKLKKNAGIDVEGIKRQMTETYESKLSEKDKVIQDKDGHIYKLLVSSGFNASKFVNEKLLLPADIAEATFGKHFKIEDGRVIAYLGDNKILSREKPGELANFDEALQVIVEQYPMKDRILKATEQSGSGRQQDGGPAMGGFNQQMAGLSPVQRITAAREAGQKT